MRRILAALACLGCAHAPLAASEPGVEAFNRAFDAATRAMDDDASIALWEDDGISLLPSTPPVRGKAAIARFIRDVKVQIPGARMRFFEMRCYDIEVSGAWADEWCVEHQIVDLPDKPPFDGWGKLLLVLHRGSDGRWRIQREMWNPSLPSF